MKRIKYGKIILVVFLTILIWVWADLALDEELADRPATIVVVKAANPKLQVDLNKASAVDIRVTLSGPHSAIVEAKRRLKEEGVLRFDFDAAQEKMTQPGSYTLNVLSFLQKDREMRQFGLKVKACQPETVEVNVLGLVKKSLKVECVNEEQLPIKDAIAKPSQVEMFVPQDWVGDARVQLTAIEIKQARLSAIKKRAYVIMPGNQKKESVEIIQITTPLEEELLRADTIKNATLGFNLSANTQGKYTIEVVNLTEVMGSIAIRSTPAAKRAYENMPYQVILEIHDKDVESTEVLRRKLIYNFPAEYVREDEIRLNQQPVTAQFKLVPITVTESP